MSKREIKFRAWRTDLDCYVIDVELLNLEESFRATIEQYTGLKDANDIEIYEGDIITFTFKTSGGHFTYTGKVIFEQYMFLVEIENGDCFSLNRIGGVNLIGNIHENPMLCK